MNESERNIMPELPKAIERPEFLSGDDWFDTDVDAYRLDFAKAYEAPRYTMAWNGIGFAPLGGIHAITGQAGNGKTMILAQFMTAILSGKYGSISYSLGETEPHPRVLYIDTEMEEANTIAVKNRVMTMCQRDITENDDDFVVLMLREVPEAVKTIIGKKGDEIQTKVPAAVMRWRMVLKAIWEYKPTVAFIDGLLDVVADFNDNILCQEIIYKCMQVASHYGISVWCVVHQNPGGEKLVGHLGSFLERKVTDIFQTKKDKKEGDVTFTVKQLKARGRDIDDWKFKVLPIDGWGIPEQITDTPAEQKAKYSPIEVKGWLEQNQKAVEWPATLTEIRNKIFRDGVGIKHNDDLQQCVTISINRRFLLPQGEEEMEKGQKKPKYNLNPEFIDALPF